MSSPYRDSLGAQRERLKALDRQLRELEQTFTPVFWSEAAPVFTLEPPIPADLPGEDASPEVMMGAVTSCEERLAALKNLSDHFREVEEWWSLPSDEPPPLEILPEPLEVKMNRPFKTPGAGKDAFAETVGAFARGVKIKELSSYALGARIESEGVSFAVTYQGWSTGRSNAQEPVNKVTARVPRGLGDFTIKPQGIGDEILAKLRLRQDIVLGHHDFDGYFLVQGDESAAKGALTRAIREKLLQIARRDIPSLKISRGVADLWWMFDMTRNDLILAVEALRFIREAHPTRPLRFS